MKNKKNLIIALLTTLFLISALSLLYFSRSKVLKLFRKEETWLNIFVHGTIGSALGFLDFQAMQNDQVEGTIYKKTLSIMRKNAFFFQEQPLGKRGMLKIQPTFKKDEKQSINIAANPIIKSFEAFESAILGKNKNNINYLFGWSGLMSQKRRRLEAVRFYNQLSQEIQALKKNGINPKIRIISHSHGGNLSLNLAGVAHKINSSEEFSNFYENFEAGDYVKSKFDELFKRLSSSQATYKEKGQKKFDHLPENKNLIVDELIILGTPIQFETSLFAYSPFFKKVYNVYSDEDMVQGVDFVSTVKAKSSQRIELDLKENFEEKNELFQIRIIVKPSSEIDSIKIKGSDNSVWWKVILGLKDTSRKSYNPTHKELWFLVPVDQDDMASFIRPIPIVSLLPVITHLANLNDKNDLDVELLLEENKFIARSFINKKEEIIGQIKINIEILDFIKNELKFWELPNEGREISKKMMEKLIKIARSLNINLPKARAEKQNKG